MNRLKIVRYFSIIVIFSLTFTLIQGYYPIIFLKSWIFLGIHAMLIAALFPNIFLRKSFVWLGVYAVVLLFNALAGDEVFGFGFGLTEVTFYFIPTALFSLYISEGNLKSLTTISAGCIVIIVATSLMTIPQAFDNPGLIRSIVGAQINQDPNYIIEKFKKGVSGYSMPHALPFIIPPFVFLVKNKNVAFKVRLLSLTFLVVSAVFIFFTETTGPVILFLFTLILSFSINSNKSIHFNSVKILFMSVIVLVLFNVVTINNLLYFIGANTEEMAYYGKVQDLEVMLESGRADGEIAYRQSLHAISWNTFTENFIIGSNYRDQVGEHSYFMDRAALLGILGFIPLILFFYTHIKKAYRHIPDSTRMFYLIGVTSCIILGFQKNMSGFEYWFYLFFLLPSLCVIFSRFVTAKVPTDSFKVSWNENFSNIA